MSKRHPVFTESFAFFFSNAVKTRNLYGIRISDILEDHLLENIYMQHLYRNDTSAFDFKHLKIFYNFHPTKQTF